MNLGELWVSYEVELIHEKLGQGEDQTYSYLEASSVTSGFASWTSLLQFSGTPISATSGSLYLQSMAPGYYVLSITASGSGTLT